MNNLKKIIGLSVLSFTMIMSGCYPTNTWDEDDNDVVNPVETTIRYSNIFPFAEAGRVWEYRDEDGNDFKISVVDTISDDEDLYYKVEFREVKLEMVQDDWFVKENGTIKYNDGLQGTFDQFLPSSFKRSGGSFSCGYENINYEILDSMTIGNNTYTDVLKLIYNTAVLHGFDEIYFADNIGIIRMIDEDGRWPVDYMLN